MPTTIVTAANAPGVTAPPAIDDRRDRVAVIGAGTSGLAITKRLREASIAVDCLERESDIGGNWNYALPCSRVIGSTHLISSKAQTEYPDHPMPDEWPEYPSHRRVLEYLRSYADRFDLRESIEFDSGVRRLTPLEPGRGDSGWLVELESGARRRYRAVAIANGHNWDPSFPVWSGRVDPASPFRGTELHSGEYKTPNTIAGKRVLVVGGGNSGCDIAAEASRHAGVTRLSLRRGYHILPKFYRGLPIDAVGEKLLRWRLPLAMRRALAGAMSYLVLGPRRGTGLPRPDHRLFETHPTINSQLVEQLRHGDLEVRPDVRSATPAGVRFVDGREESFDLIIHATGYKLSLPFLDPEHLPWRGERPDLFLNVFPKQRDDLFLLGLIQPDSGQWGLVDRQARLVARVLELDDEQRARFATRKRSPAPKSAIRYLDSARHALEVEHFSYARTLDQELRRLERGVGVRGR